MTERARLTAEDHCVIHGEQVDIDAMPAFGCSGCAQVNFVRLVAEVTALQAERAWQDIASAPKMRKVIVTYVNELGKRRTVMACYYKAHSLEMHDDYADVGEYDETSGCSYAPEGWYEEHEGDSPLMPLTCEPTHWMPLPEAPK